MCMCVDVRKQSQGKSQESLFLLYSPYILHQRVCVLTSGLLNDCFMLMSVDSSQLCF